MRSYLKNAVSVSAILALGAALLGSSASAADADSRVVSQASDKGTNTINCQYLFEADVAGGQVNWCRMVIIQDLPEPVAFTEARIRETNTKLDVIALHSERTRGLGVRQVEGLVFPISMLRESKKGLNFELYSIADTVKIRVTQGYIRSFLKQVDAKIKKG